MPSRRPVARLLIPPAALLGLGLATSLSIAWGFAMRGRPAQTSWIRGPGGDRLHTDHILVERGVGMERRSIPQKALAFSLASPQQVTQGMADAARQTLLWGVDDGTFPAWWGRVPSMQPATPAHRWTGIIQDARGWPLPALWCEWNHHWPSQAGRPVTLLHGGLALPSRSGRPRALPYRPVWLGLGANTLIFAAAWAAAAHLSIHARRAHRRNHNRCPACAYSRTGLAPDAPCPECGATERNRMPPPTADARACTPVRTS